MEKGMFEKASRLKLRFKTNVGNVLTEDLWDLPLTSRSRTSLDDLAKALNRASKESGEESFVVKKNITNARIELKFSIVKHIIKTKLEEAESKENATLVKVKKERIMSLIADKEDDELKNMDKEDLKKMVSEL